MFEVDFFVRSWVESGKTVSEDHIFHWAVSDGDIILLKAKHHALQTWRSACKAFLLDHLQRFVVRFHHEGFAIDIGVETLTSEDNCK